MYKHRLSVDKPCNYESSNRWCSLQPLDHRCLLRFSYALINPLPANTRKYQSEFILHIQCILHGTSSRICSRFTSSNSSAFQHVKMEDTRNPNPDICPFIRALSTGSEANVSHTSFFDEYIATAMPSSTPVRATTAGIAFHSSLNSLSKYPAFLVPRLWWLVECAC